MLAIAAAAAIGSCVAGTILSFHLDAATGPTIVVTQAGVFVAALAWHVMRARERAVGEGGPSPNLSPAQDRGEERA